MAKLIGGLHGRPSGNVGGIVYGGARTRIGKVVTARELVVPANPQTGDQTLQRNKFTSSLNIVRGLGPQVYLEDFNRSIGQLPGFQSMMSIFLNATGDNYALSIPPVTPLGDLHYPITTQVLEGIAGAGSLQVVFSSENGSNGTPADDTIFFCMATLPDETYVRDFKVMYQLSDRQTQGFNVTDLLPASSYLCALYFTGVGTALSLTSQCKWFTQTTAGA